MVRRAHREFKVFPDQKVRSVHPVFKVWWVQPGRKGSKVRQVLQEYKV